MNEKFFSLPQEKQTAIINAGYRVFSQNTYKNSPTSEIAREAGISKSLLFHYFINKKDLYMYLWEYAAAFTKKRLQEYGCYEPIGLFPAMERGMKAKLDIMRQYPDMANFTIKAFYEKDPEIYPLVQESYKRLYDRKSAAEQIHLDPDQFIPGLDISMMYRDMYWATEGYCWEMLQSGNMDFEKIEDDFTKLMEFWKMIYLKKN